MSPFPIVIDNDSLAHLVWIDSKHPLLNTMRSLFSAIHIPQEVLNEFQKGYKNPERRKIIDQIDSGNKFLKKCVTYDTFSKAILETVKGIDDGEAAVIAQHLKVGSRFVVSEDEAFHKNIKKIYPHAKVYKVKHILAILDIHKYLNDWKECISLLYEKKTKITSEELRDAYTEMAAMYGINIDRKIISHKTSLKRMGIIVK